VSVLFILIKGKLLHSFLVKSVDIDLVIVFTVYFLASNESSPCIFAFCQGFLLDILSGGVLGLFTLLYLFVYFVIRLASHPIDLLSPVGRAAVVFIAVSAKELLMLVLLNIFSLQYEFSIDSLFYFFLSAILTSVLSVFVFHFFKISPAMESPAGGEI
jgi:rod shape-determining protein MreD